MRWMLAVLMACLLAGCSSGSEAAPSPTPSAPTSSSPAPSDATAAPVPTPESVEPTGAPAPEALSSFRCEAAKDDLWVAAGFLSNSGKKPVTYQVSVHVGPLDGTARTVRTKRVDQVEAGGSVRFEINEIPADGTQCHVQVIRTDVE